MDLPIPIILIRFLAFLILSKVLTAQEPFRVISYNIRFQNQQDGENGWEHRKTTVATFLQDAELVGLQEVVAGQFEYLKEQTPDLTWLGVGRNDGLKDGEMCPLGWRTSRFLCLESGTFWLSDTPEKIGKAGWDAALPRIATWVRLVDLSTLDGPSPKTVLWINTHFDHQGAVARKNSGIQIRQWLHSRQERSDVIVTGDFNATLDSPPLREMTEAPADTSPGLREARGVSAVRDPGPESTWNGFREIQLGRRIDHILFSPENLAISRFQTLDPRTPSGRFASDHLPIVATFYWLSRDR